MKKTTIRMTADQFTGFLETIPPGADIKREGLTVTVSAVRRSTGVLETVISAHQRRDGAWDVTGPAPLFKVTVTKEAA